MPGFSRLVLTPQVSSPGNEKIWNQVSKSYASAQSQKILHLGSWEERNKASGSQNPNVMYVIQTQVVENTNVVTLFFKEVKENNEINWRFYDEKFLTF